MSLYSGLDEQRRYVLSSEAKINPNTHEDFCHFVCREGGVGEITKTQNQRI